MTDNTMFIKQKLTVSQEAHYPLQAFVRDNHIALAGSGEGPLKDLVFSAKDVFKIKGSTWGNGHPDWLKHSPPDEFTATAVELLLDSGADLVGKAVCDELCYSISGENWNYGSPLNPHDVRRFTGGSSSGTCASVAGGLVDFSIGSDCLGSVRVPASYNGLLGMRPTYQRVDNEGEAPYCESMDVLGYVAKEPAVFRQISQVLLGEDDEKYQFTKLLIADDCFDGIDADVKEALNPAIVLLSEFITDVEHINLTDSLADWVSVFQMVQGYEVWESYGGFVNKYQPRLSPGPKSRLEFASTITMRQYNENLAKMAEIKEHLTALLPKDALLVMPTASSVAPLKSASQEEINHYRQQSSKLLCVSPLAGLPQLTMPLVSQHNVPLGLSIIGAHHTDMSMVNFACKVMEAQEKIN